MKEQDLGHGNKIIGFDSPEEMFAYLEDQAKKFEESMETLSETQKGITWGSYAIKVIPWGEEELLAIFGYIYTEADVERMEIDSGAEIEDGELDAIMHRLRVSHEEGHRYATWYSVVAPQGDMGDNHVADLWPITEADYHHAQNNGWEMPEYLDTRIREEVQRETDPGDGPREESEGEDEIDS